MSSMIIHNVIQGSAEWHALRGMFDTASEAPVMMGASKNMKRNELLHAKQTGLSKDVNWWVQRFLFDRGHEAEALARPIAEGIAGEELYPVTGSLNDLLASMDGMTMLGDTLFEHKLWNEALAAAIRAKELDPLYYWQLEQQLYVAQAKRVLFMCSDGTEENCVWMWYEAVPGRIEQLLAGWEQFNKDLIDYVPVVDVPTPIGATPDALPALRIEVTGMVTASNLDVFKEQALTVFRGIKTDLQVDQDFADAEKTVKWCKDVEERLEAAKQHALSQTSSIDELFRAIDAISAEAKTKRLELDKLVKARKEAIRLEIVTKAMKALKTHYDSVNATLGEYVIAWPSHAAGYFSEAIKNKRTISSLQDAVDTTLASMKIEANQLADQRRLSVATLEKESAGYEHLFADRLHICSTKAPEDIRNLVATRIADFNAKEAERKAVAAPVATVIDEPLPFDPEPTPELDDEFDVPAAPAQARTQATMKLGELNELLAPITLTADGLAELGFKPVGIERTAKLYNVSDVSGICAALIQRLTVVGRRQEAA